MTGAAGAAALLLSVALVWVRRFDVAIQLCALQALVVAPVLAELSAAAAVLAFGLNGVALPLALTWMRGPASLDWRTGPAAIGTAVLVGVAGLVLLFAGLGANDALAAGGAVVLLGVALAGSRSHALGAALGLLSAQNGLVLLAAASPSLALPPALLAAVPLVPALLLAESWCRR